MRTGGNAITKFIPPSERMRALRLPKDRELRFTVGQWVQVLRGKYKGDLGLVKELFPWGRVCLLMVPRLPPPDRSSIKKGKRPRSTAPPPLSLFDPLFIKKTFNVVPKKKGNTYFFNGDKFEDGLLLKVFGASNVSPAVSITTETHSLFFESQHPLILRFAIGPTGEFPNPGEWHFFPGELVRAFSDTAYGIYGLGLGHIRNVESEYIEVQLKSGALLSLKWYDVVKFFEVGELVEVVGGVHKGRMGFVVGVDSPDISIAEKLGEEVLYCSLERLLSTDFTLLIVVSSPQEQCKNNGNFCIPAPWSGRSRRSNRRTTPLRSHGLCRIYAT
jgi:hypothetical protein